MPPQINLKLRDLRIAKLNRKQRVVKCEEELEYFLNAVSHYGGESKVPKDISKALAACMDAPPVSVSVI